MTSAVQHFLLWLYPRIRDTGVLDTRWGDAIYRFAYSLYKTNVEAGDVRALEALVRPGSVVLDVGAHIGFFSLMFARWVSGGGRVIAVEPEKSNFRRLKAAVAGAGFGEMIDLVCAAVAEKTGVVSLSGDPDNPADHYLDDDGTPVSAVTIDDLLRQRGNPEVSLIKVDVQGGEPRVLDGATETIAKWRPALFLEVDDVSLSRAGHSAEGLLAHLRGLGYVPRFLRGRTVSEIQQTEQILDRIGTYGYSDVLFVPREWEPGLESTGRDRKPIGFGSSSILTLGVLIAAITAAWYWLAIVKDVGFWWFSGDYIYLSLAHAFGMDDWLLGSGERTLTPAKTMHPGMPLQLVSWVVLRLAALIDGPAADSNLLIHTLQHPQTFARISQVAVLLMSLLAVTLIWSLARPYGWPILLSACLASFTVYEFWHYGLIELGNESFALIGAVLFLLGARAAFSGDRNGYRQWIVFGGLGGLVYLVKLHYIVWSAAVPIGLLAAGVAGRWRWQEVLRAGSAFALGFILVAALLGGAMVGGAGLLEMFEQHMRVVTRTGLYGHGESGIVAVSALRKGFSYLANNKEFTLAAGLVGVTALAVMIAKRRDPSWRARHLPLGITLLAALVLSIGAALKHFQPHYLVVGVVVLPLVILWLAAAAGRYVGWIMVLPMLVFVGFEAKSTIFDYRPSALAQVDNWRQDFAAVQGLSLRPGELRLWAKAPGPGFRRAQVIHMTGIERYRKLYWETYDTDRMITARLVAPHDKRSKKAWDGLPWRYVVFDKRRVATLDNVPPQFAGSGRTIHQIGMFTVVERLP